MFLFKDIGKSILIGLSLAKGMHKLSFKVSHKNCYETALSRQFPKHYITVIDIQSTQKKEKQYLYYITGDATKFDNICQAIKKSKGYQFIKEIERSPETLLLLVVLHQQSYIQNIIQKYHGFLIDIHTVSGGYEYWHIGVIDRISIDKMIQEFEKMGELKVLSIGKVDFAHANISKQQKRILLYAYRTGYYELPRKTTIAKIAHALKLSPATVGEHLLKAENRLMQRAIKDL